MALDLALTAVLASAFAVPATAVAADASYVPATERPFRQSVQIMNAGLDRQKPLALLDSAGFVINSGVLIGAVDDRWVGGKSLTTNEFLWWHDGGVAMTAPPGSFGSSVVLGFRDGKIVKLDALTGKKQWAADLDSYTERSMLLNGTTLYVLTSGQVLSAVDFQTGKTLWLYDAGFPERLSIRAGAKPVFVDGKVIFGIASGEIIAVDAATGKLAWPAAYNPSYSDARFHDVVGEMAVRNNRLYISRYDGLLAAIDLGAATLSTTWQEQLPGITTSTFRGGQLVVGGLNGDVYAIDTDNGGRRLWRTVTGQAVSSITSGESTLFVAGTKGQITALDAATGSILWTDNLSSAVASPPILHENSIYFATGLKAIYSYRLR